MPYYVYAIHSDTVRLYGKFDDFKKATEVENEMQAGWSPKDNYIVKMIHAETDEEAEKKANSLRI